MRNALTRWRWEHTGNKMKMVDGGNESTRNEKKPKWKKYYVWKTCERVWDMEKKTNFPDIIKTLECKIWRESKNVRSLTVWMKMKWWKKRSVYTKVTALRKAKTYRVQKNIARRFLVFGVVEPNEYFYKCNFKTFLIYPAYAMLLPRRVFLSSKRFDALLEIDRQFRTAQQRLFLPLMRWNENLCIRIIHIPHSTPTKKKLHMEMNK